MGYAIKFTEAGLARLTYQHILSAQRRDDARRPDSVLARDTGSPLLLRAYRDSAVRVFVVMTTIRGTKRQGYTRLGAVGVLPLAEAQAKAAGARAAMLSGADPRTQRAEQRLAGAAAMTLQEVLDHYVSHHGASAGHCIDVRQRIETYLKPWLRRPLLAVTRQMWIELWGGKDAEKILAAIREGRRSATYTGYKTANSVHTDFTVLWGYFNRVFGDHVAVPACPNMAVARIKYDRKKKSRVTASNAAQLWAALPSYAGNPHHRIFYELLLRTGMRSIEAKHLQWERCAGEHDASAYTWIDAGAGHLVLPGEFTKTGVRGSEFYVPLTPATRALLAEAKAIRDEFHPESPWVFPSSGDSGHLEANNNIYKRIGAHAGLRLDMHSTRHMFRDVLRALGASTEKQDAALNQTTPGMSAVYGDRLTHVEHAALLVAVDQWFANLPQRVTTASIAPRVPVLRLVETAA